MAELADATDLKSVETWAHAGSSPALGTGSPLPRQVSSCYNEALQCFRRFHK